MTPKMPMDAHHEPRGPISTFAVLDLETTNLPEHRNNRVSITELCIYAFDPAVLKDNKNSKDELPSPPRVMHKLNLLFQPSMLVLSEAEHITGLSNYILERESKLNENAGELIKRFMEHLPSPVCLVAHNGWHFDFPIIKQALNKVNISLPASTLCVDSLRAFMEIDDMRVDVVNSTFPTDVDVVNSTLPTERIDISDNLTEAVDQKEINWQSVNESTPKRPILNRLDGLKRRHMNSDGTDMPGNKRPSQDLHSRRQLFGGVNYSATKRFPPAGLYRLSNLYSRIFKRPAENAHEAEADVHMLTKLIQHYNVDFLAFAEEQAIPFADVVPLGSKNSNSTR